MTWIMHLQRYIFQIYQRLHFKSCPLVHLLYNDVAQVTMAMNMTHHAVSKESLIVVHENPSF